MNFFLLSLLTIFILNKPANGQQNCVSLVSVNSSVERYTASFLDLIDEDLPRIEKVKLVLYYMHNKELGVGSKSKVYSFKNFLKLYKVFGTKRIKSVDDILEWARRNKQSDFILLKPKELESFKRIYNEYMREHPANLLFGLAASEIIRSRMAIGCTMFARSFIAITKSLNIFNDDEIRYVVTTAYKDYNKQCPRGIDSVRKEKETLNGHQFVSVKLNGKWWFLNTSSANYEAIPNSINDEYLSRNISIEFPSLKSEREFGHNKLLIRYISKDVKSVICDNTFKRLMNISVSGSKDKSQCHWPLYSY